MKQPEEQWMAICIPISICMGSRICICIWICITLFSPPNGLFGLLPPFAVAFRVWHLYGFQLFLLFSDILIGGKPLFMAVMECNRATDTIQNAAHILPLPDELWLNCDVSVGGCGWGWGCGWGGCPSSHTTCLTVPIQCRQVLQIGVPLQRLTTADPDIPFMFHWVRLPFLSKKAVQIISHIYSHMNLHPR